MTASPSCVARVTRLAHIARTACLVTLACASVAALAAGGGCGGHATYVRSDDTALGRVVVYRNGIAFYERRAQVEGDTLTLAVPHDKVDDFLKSLTVVDAQTGDTIPVSYPTEGASHDSTVDMAIQIPKSASKDLVITYITESPAWKPTYRVVLGADGKVDLQGWAIVDNTSGEDWEGVQVGVGSSSALSFRYDLRTVLNVHRIALGGEQRFAIAPPTGGATHGGKDDGSLVLAVRDEEIPRPDGHPDIAEAELDVALGPPPAEALSAGGRGAGGMFRERRSLWAGSKSAQAPRPSAAPAAASHPAYQQRAQAERKVKELADKLKATSGTIVIEGYGAAGEGDADDRAAERANLMKNQLIAEGIAPGRLHVVARGAVEGRSAGVDLKVEGQATPGDTAGAAPEDGQPVGESHFQSKTPMTIARGTSAMVSILASDAAGEIVYLYDPEAERGDRRFAFKSVRFVNPTDSTLETGPVTVYGEGRFIGEGLTSSIPPGATAVIPFALDRQVVVESNDGTQDRIAKLVKVQRGVMTAEVEHVRRTELKLTNRMRTPARTFLRHTVRKGWTLSKSPTLHERLGESHLFEVTLAGGETKTVTIEEATPMTRTVDLRTPTGVHLVRVFLETPPDDDRFGDQVKKILAIHDEMVDHEDAIANLHDRMGEYRTRMDELHTQIASLKQAKVGGQLMTHLKKKLEDISERVQAATIDVVNHQEGMMLSRIRFQDAVSELSLQPTPKATAGAAVQNG